MEWSGVESVSLSVESVESVESVSESVSGETRTDRGGNLTEGSDLRRERRPMMEDRAMMYLSDFRVNRRCHMLANARRELVRRAPP